MQNYKQEFIEWLKANYKSDSGKLSSYVKAIELLEQPLRYDVFIKKDMNLLNELYTDLLNDQRDKDGIYYNPDSPSYGQGGFYSAAIKKYIEFIKERKEMALQPEFFTQREFDLLKETEGKKNIKSDKHLSEAYKDLSKAYRKVEYWMNELQRRVFPTGKVHIYKRPTNQANNFDGYLWGKIYPTQEDQKSKWLAFTVGLDGSNCFNVKIDTVGLDDKDKLRQDYFKYRGDYNNSKIVKRYSFKNIDNWLDLLENSEEDLHVFIKHWENLKSLKEGGMVNEVAVG